MMRRDPEIAPWRILVERAGRDADRQDVLLAQREPPGIAALADPLDRPDRAVHRHHAIADSQRLDHDFATIGQDQGAGAVAGDGSDKGRGQRRAIEDHFEGIAGMNPVELLTVTKSLPFCALSSIDLQ